MELYCLGDSLTYGYGIPRRKCWTTLIAEKTGITTHNLGINGDTTGGMLVRAVTQVIPNCDKSNSCVLLMGGYNDIFCAGSDSLARANISAIVHQFNHALIKPIIGIPIGLHGSDYPPAWNALVDFSSAKCQAAEYNAWLRTFCHSFNVDYIDFEVLFANNEHIETLYLDGIHPSAEGHKLIANKVINYLTEKGYLYR